jgi:phosphate/sulfate permease
MPGLITAWIFTLPVTIIVAVAAFYALDV